MIRPDMGVGDWICLHDTDGALYFGGVVSRTSDQVEILLRMPPDVDWLNTFEEPRLKSLRVDNLGPNPYDLKEIS